MINWYLIYAYTLGLSFVLSAVLTELTRRAAMRWRVLDHPGERKMQAAPVPLGGGVAIFASFSLVIVLNLLLLDPVRELGFPWLERNVFHFLGADVTLKLTGLMAGGVIIFALGVLDDVFTLNPEKKLAGQVLAALAVVMSGIRLDLFLPELWGAGWPVELAGAVLTMFWIIFMTNSMNFLDNMDGLCGGVSAIAAVSMLLILMPHDTFVCVLLTVFTGAVCGFLLHNLNPARIYMGDAGSMFCGYALATAAVLATFYWENTPSRVAVLAPLVALSVPIFDTLSVIWIRASKGESIMKGDKRHFSHRLVKLGMTPLQAVSFIFLVAAVSGLGAILLRQLDAWGTALVIAQVVGLYSLIAILMRTRLNGQSESDW